MKSFRIASFPVVEQGETVDWVISQCIKGIKKQALQMQEDSKVQVWIDWTTLKIEDVHAWSDSDWEYWNGPDWKKHRDEHEKRCAGRISLVISVMATCS